MIDNVQQLRKYLMFNQNGDSFYQIQIIQRRNDNPELARNARTIKIYHIKSTEQFDELYGEMKTLADTFNARIYLNVNRRSFEQLGREMLLKIPNVFLSGSYKTMNSAYESLVGKYSAEPRDTKLWLIDIDTKDLVELAKVTDWIGNNHGRSTISTLIPTKNGFHVLTHPFRSDEYIKLFPEHEIKRDSPTILYVP